jgi:tetratricopeptide (TPR) repeat protein
LFASRSLKWRCPRTPPHDTSKDQIGKDQIGKDQIGKDQIMTANTLATLANPPHSHIPSSAPVPVFEDILVPYQKPLKKPLPVWAANVRGQFDELRERARHDLNGTINNMVTCYNEAALLEVHYGRLKTGAALCEASLEWLDRCCVHVDAVNVLRYSFQPYINLGRLDRIQGRYEEALDKFGAVYRAYRGDAAQIGRFHITSPMNVAIFTGPDSPARLARTIYVLEFLKTFLKTKWWDRAVDFAASAERQAGDITGRDILAEGSIVALGRLGRYPEAIAAGEPILAEREGPNRMLFLYRRAEVFAAAGRMDDARRIAGKLAAGFLAYPGPLSLTRVDLLARLAVFLAWLEASEANSVAELGYRTATQLDDVLLRAHFLNVLATLPENDASALHAQVRAIKKDGWYGGAKDTQTMPGNVVDELSSTLFEYARQDPLQNGDRT